MKKILVGVLGVSALGGAAYALSNGDFGFSNEGEAERMDAAYAHYQEGNYEDAICDVSYLYTDTETEQSRERVQDAGNQMMRNISETDWGNHPANAHYLSVAGEILNNDSDPQRAESLEESLDDLC